MRKNFNIALGLALLLGLNGLSSKLLALDEQPTKLKGSEHSKKIDSSKDENSSFEELASEYLQDFFRNNPVDATYFGVHEYDSSLNAIDKELIAKQETELRQALSRFQSIDFDRLSSKNKVDWNLVLGNIKSRLLSLVTIREWRNNPDVHSSHANTSVFALIQRNFAPKSERLKSVIEREKKIPLYLETAKKNLEPALVPRIYAEICLEKMPGILSFFKNDLVKHFEDVEDKQALCEFEKANKACIEALESYQTFVKTDILPSSKTEFALGEKSYLEKLYCEELVGESIDQLLEKGERELKRLQVEFKALAKKIDPNLNPTQAYEKVSSKHPAPDKLISSVSSVLEEIRQFCVEKPVVTIPGEQRATVTEMPPFMRALAFAAMDTPGPFEKKAKEAFYFVTLPEADWSKKKIEEHMRSFSYQDLLNTSIHEAYPGHYVQFLWVNKAPSSIRKVFGCNSNAEGWAHYCEKMMLEEGFRDANAELKIVQIHDALLRACRYIAGIKMHTRGMSLEKAIELFEKEGYQEHANAEREAKRGTMDPTYLVYTLGKLDILSMREEYRAKMKDSYKIRDFHDSFLKQGYPPLGLVRAEMLQEDVKKYF